MQSISYALSFLRNGATGVCQQLSASLPVQVRRALLKPLTAKSKTGETTGVTECRLVDEIVWVKSTVNRKLAKSHGYYLQHAKEVCLVGLRGEAPEGWQGSVMSDVIFAERRGQSQKPEQVYELIEEMVPHGVPLMCHPEYAWSMSNHPPALSIEWARHG
jgi:hypothetical protein